MDTRFNPQEFEKKIYEKWLSQGCFTPKIDKSKKPFTIVLPPPNITGQLHMGHALNHTLQDAIIRYKRMCGFATLWVPGTDHASIATEVKVLDKLHKETGKTKQEIGREEFLKSAYEWKKQYGGKICEQIKRLGDSCDWSREAFTMDEKCSKAVREVFVKLYNKGLIYKGNRMTHWCPCCKTALSDAEVEFEEQNSNLWHIRYPYEDGKGEIVVATTRPETLLGDSAVAVNPNDKRYSKVVGKNLILPLTNRKIPVIADEYVETEFGTGAVKITPAHDMNDFEVGKRHNLDIITVINEDGTMADCTGEFAGMDSLMARKLIVDKLKEQGFLIKTEPYKHNVGVCYRCHTTIEPRISDQWYVKMEPLAKPAIEAVQKGEVKFNPQRFEKIYFNWMNNIKDWCISRQLWWGHRIPCWYCDDCGKMNVAMDTPTHCSHCGSSKLHQDEDVLDTWFSSALWPFSTLGYPDKTEDLQYFYPTSLLVTAYDIIFFWVARMIFSGIEYTGKVPFSEVLIHGLVRDSQGRKMSKSLGNGIDPLEVIDNYGADALRFSLLQGVSNGMDIRFSDERLESSRNFMNKLWNASRYVKMNIDGKNLKDITEVNFTNADKWILKKLNNIIVETRKNMEKYEFNLVVENLYSFVWSDFCDWYIELSKPALYSDNEELKTNTLSVLKYVLENILKLCHPLIPFITEEIWSEFEDSTLMIQQYPKENPEFKFKGENFEIVKQIIEKVRSIRADMKVAKNITFPIYIKVFDNKFKESIEQGKSYLEKLAGVSNYIFIDNKSDIKEKVSQAVTDAVEFYIPLGNLVDFEKEKARISKEIDDLTKQIERSENLLNNQGFISKAPKSLIEESKEKLASKKATKEKLLEQLKNLD